MAARTGMWVGIVLVAVGVAGVLFGPRIADAVGGRAYGGMMSAGYGMMGGKSAGAGYGMMNGSSYGMMGGGYGGDGNSAPGAASGTVPSSEVARMGNAVPTGATVIRSGNRIVFSGSDVRFTVLGGPQGQRDLTYRIAGLVNPSVVVPKGASVHIEFVNADASMPHNFVLTAAAPPFTAGVPTSTAFAGAGTSVLSPGSNGEMNEQGLTFTATSTGTYTYLCTVPGHAAGGMYGRFIVQ